MLHSNGGLKFENTEDIGENLRFLNDPLMGNFQNSVPQGFITSAIHVLCVNFMKIGLLEIGKVVHWLPAIPGQKQNFASL